MAQSQLCALLLCACLAAAAVAQEIRTYTREELFPGQICGDDGQGWEWKNIGECPQGYNGIRKWAKERGILPGSKATTSTEDKPGAFRWAAVAGMGIRLYAAHECDSLDIGFTTSSV